MKAAGTTLRTAAVLLALLAGACGKATQDGAGHGVPGPSAGSGPLDIPPDLDATACTATPQPGPSPLRRLSGFQIKSTLRDLFRDAPAVLEAVQIELDELGSPYWSQLREPLEPPVEVTIEMYHRIAQRAAQAGSEPASLNALTGCAPLGDDETACRDQFLERWLGLSYRRPPSEDDLSEMRQVFATGRELGGGFASGVRAVLEVVLQGPDFLYLIEQAEGDVVSGVAALGSYETAARLSYFLTGSMPDAELLAAAQAGPFSAADAEAQARRLLGSPGSRLVTRHFFERLLRLENVTALAEQAKYSEAIAQLALEETGKFVEHVTFDGAGTFGALLTEPYSFMNAELAAFYGQTGVAGDAFQLVPLDPARRAGVLTQSAFLTSTSSGGRTRPVQRGLSVLTKILCLELPPPPPDVATPLDPTIPGPVTTRQQLELATQSVACQDCHRDIDPIGFAFEHYDAVGLWRDTEGGLPIDSSGTLHETDVPGAFAGAIELVQRIARSEDAQACFGKNWLRYSHGREPAPEDACALEQLDAAARDSGGNVVELLVALAKTDQFRYRMGSELEH